MKLARSALFDSRFRSRPSLRSLRWPAILLAVACLGAPWAHEALAAPAPEPQQTRGGAAAARAGGGSSGGGSATRGGASQGRSTATRGGGAAGARAGAGGGKGKRTSVHRSPRTRGGDRGHRFHGHYGGHHHYHFPYSLRFGYYGYPYYLSYHHYRPYGYYGPRWYDYPVSDDFGALDLNVKPKKAEVYVDGQRIGKVGAFDGYPNMLWLEEGVHDVVIYRPGYETWYQQVKVLPGVVIDIDERLEEGVATPPEDIVPPPTRRAPAVGERAPEAREDGGPDDNGRRVDLRHEPARLYLAVEPADASVYLDGRFLGTGEELAALRHGLMVNPGAHRLSVVRPSFESQEMEIEAGAGEDLDLVVSLERKARAQERP